MGESYLKSLAPGVVSQQEKNEFEIRPILGRNPYPLLPAGTFESMMFPTSPGSLNSQQFPLPGFNNTTPSHKNIHVQNLPPPKKEKTMLSNATLKKQTRPLLGLAPVFGEIYVQKQCHFGHPKYSRMGCFERSQLHARYGCNVAVPKLGSTSWVGEDMGWNWGSGNGSHHWILHNPAYRNLVNEFDVY